MAITEMVAVNIAGKIEEFEGVVNKYVYNREIHLENALSVLGNKKRLRSFTDGVQYDSIVKTAEDILSLAKIKAEDTEASPSDMTAEEMKKFLDDINLSIEEKTKKTGELTEKIEANSTAAKSLENLKNVTCDISRMSDMRYVRYRYGHIPRGGYKMLNTYLSDMDIIFAKTYEDENNVWGFYFVPAEEAVRVDEIFASLYFERVIIPRDLTGSPGEMVAQLNAAGEEYRREIEQLSAEISDMLKDYRSDIISVYETAKSRQVLNEVRTKAAHSKDFFYIVGWMSKKDARRLEEEISGDDGIEVFYTENPENLKDIIAPPTKLKNNAVFRPFEMFVNMYGCPGYNEIDPTPLLAVTYILFFGMMFGDVGQSALLAIGGFIVYRLTKMQLAAILGIVGVSGTAFGFLYGSVFGNEEIIHGVLSPMENIQTLLIGTVAMGAVIITLGLVLNIINLHKQHKHGEMIFGHNGIAGLVFYVSLLAVVLSMLLKWSFIPQKPLIGLIVTALIAMYFSEPLAKLVDGEKNWRPNEGIFYVQSLFEMLEVLLSYFSNTISFLRIGAFAIVHVGMMMAVDALAQGGTAKVIIVSVLGNILVMVLEGIVVAIQVLRLEYYEMFSRYFTGNGKPFVSLRNK